MSETSPTVSADGLQQLAEQIRSRRTINMFEERPVSRDLIMEAIEVARWAPNHRLTEPWRFYVLGDEAIKKSVEMTRIVVTERKGEELGNFKAKAAATRPGWLLVTCQRSDDELRQQEDYASVACAIQNLMLFLSEAGVGTKWATGPIIRDSRYYEALGIDESVEFIAGVVWYGYPKVVPEQRRREVAEIAIELD
ncbi:MAG: nitroreductase [Pseudomonadota bacterium]